jgi:hypothetical protein
VALNFLISLRIGGNEIRSINNSTIDEASEIAVHVANIYPLGIIAKFLIAPCNICPYYCPVTKGTVN